MTAPPAMATRSLANRGTTRKAAVASSSHSGDCSRRVRQARSALEMAADERFGHSLHDQHRRNRSDERRQCPDPVPRYSRHDTEPDRSGDQDRQGTEVNHVGGPCGGQVCGKEPEPEGVHPVGPWSVNEYHPGEDRRTEQKEPQGHLHQRLGILAEVTASFEAAWRRCRHDHTYEATGSGVSPDLAPVRSLMTDPRRPLTTNRILLLQWSSVASN